MKLEKKLKFTEYRALEGWVSEGGWVRERRMDTKVAISEREERGIGRMGKTDGMETDA